MATTVARLEAVLSAKTDDFDKGTDRSEKRMGRSLVFASESFASSGRRRSSATLRRSC
jgi:hypothetical protein